MSRNSAALFTSMFEGDCISLDELSTSYEKEYLYIDEIHNEVKVKPNKKAKKKQKKEEDKVIVLSAGKEDLRGSLNKGAISTKSISCSCNKCKAIVNGTMLSYIQLQHTSIPFVTYSCTCGHIGYRSVATKALPHTEFDKFYFD